MLDITNISYYTTLIGSDGAKIDLTDYISELSWSESKGQLSQKITFRARNDKTSAGYVSDMAKPGCLVIVSVSAFGRTEEVARGKIESWSVKKDSEDNDLEVVCYDDLYPMQKSQVNYKFANGTRANKAISKIFSDWKIPRGIYDGPTVKLKQTIFTKKYIGDCLTSILESAHELGDEKYFMRATQGAIDILPYFSNSEIYCFEENGAMSITEKQSTEDLVTRVGVYSKGGQKAKVNLDGLVEYGIRQKIVEYGEGVSLNNAKIEANQILEDEGKVKQEVTLRTPDIPFLRKGDVVFIRINASNGYYDVIGVTHTADKATMTINLEYSDRNARTGHYTKKKQYFKGEMVMFIGGEYHFGRGAKTKAAKANAGIAKIAGIWKANDKNPYNYKLVHQSAQSQVNGFVTEDMFY